MLLGKNWDQFIPYWIAAWHSFRKTFDQSSHFNKHERSKTQRKKLHSKVQTEFSFCAVSVSSIVSGFFPLSFPLIPSHLILLYEASGNHCYTPHVALPSAVGPCRSEFKGRSQAHPGVVKLKCVYQPRSE